MAKLYFRYGAMNSGKSTALMQVAHNYEEQGMRVLILKPQVDTKGGGELVSRLGVRRRADLLIPPEVDVFEAVRAASAGEQPLACVLCDESQFFTPAQAEQLFMVTVDLNIPVICYGLRSDFSLKGFPGSTRLLELAHTIEEMKTICTCGRKATCNCRRVNGEFVFEGEQVAIDLENDVQYVSMTCKNPAEAATLIEYLWNGDGAAIMGSECGIPASKAGLATAQAAGKINELVAEANGKVMSFVSCQLDPLFESSDLKATGTGTYQEVFDTVDYDNKSGADVVDVLLDGMSAVGYTV